MSQLLPHPRPISIKEIAVIERALSVAGVHESSPSLAASIPTLQVVAVCGCGCASVEFSMPQAGDAPFIAADAAANAPDGEQLGLIVWAIGHSVSGLEVYNYSERPAPLPRISSIVPYGSSESPDAA